MSRDKNVVFDLEVYPNLFTNTCKEFGRDRIRQFVVWYDSNGTGETINQLEEMVDFILKEIKRFIGYNSLAYDNLLINFLLCNKEVLMKSTPRRINEDLYALSTRIINWQDYRRRKDEDKITKEMKQEMHTLINIDFFSSLDLISQFNTVDRTGLKQVAINMRWPNVQDLPFPPGSIIHKDEIPTVLDYNLNDVLITEHMLQQRSKVILLRDQISKRYEVDVFNANDTDIGKALISKYYLEETKTPYKQFIKGRSFYSFIELKECITKRSAAQLQSKESERLLKALRKTRIDPNSQDKKKQFEYIYRSQYITHNIALGGIHSINPPEIITEDESCYLLDIDVSGYYGSLIVEEGLYPRHLGPVFTKVYKEKVHIPKLLAKANGDTLAADTLKIASNAAYGLTKSIHSPFYDPKMTLTVCISGQLYLLTLIEAIEKNTGAMVVYANTDGLRIRLPKSEYNAVMQVCKLWENYTGFGLTYKQLRRMILKDVNNYLLFTYSEDKPVSAAGDFREQRPINKGYDYPIIPFALRRYYESDIPIEETINYCNDLFLYMKAERLDEDKFYATLHKRKGEIISLQKHNRWIVTDGNPEEGKLYKVDKRPENNGKTEEMQKGYFTTVANQLPKEEIPVPEEMRVNYSFYINEGLKIINIIKPSLNQSHVKPQTTQLKMF